MSRYTSTKWYIAVAALVSISLPINLYKKEVNCTPDKYLGYRYTHIKSSTDDKLINNRKSDVTLTHSDLAWVQTCSAQSSQLVQYSCGTVSHLQRDMPPPTFDVNKWIGIIHSWES